ncbi:MAG: DUF1345 domain-containing protein [Mucilaginibacter sp.]
MATTKPIKYNIFFRIDAQHRLLIAVIISAIVCIVAYPALNVPELALTTWIGAALTIILLNWIAILGTHPREVKKIARLQDSSRTLLFGFIILAAVVSLVAIIFLLKESKGLSEAQRNGHILLAIAAVFVSWWLVHTIFSLRYAHLYYDIDTDDGGTRPGGGLEFPDTPEPDYLDFIYFGFVVGMTFQVSDVQITSRKVRRLCLLHGLISFAFNTAIVALSINVISGMVSQ